MNGATSSGMATGGTPDGNRAALQAALDRGGPVYIPRGIYPLAPGAVARAPGQTVFGDGQHQTLLDCRGNGAFLSDGEWWGFGVQGLQMIGKIGGQQVTGGYAIVMDGSVGSNAAAWQMINCRVKDVLIDGMHHGVYIRDQNNFIADGVQMAAMQGDGIVCESPSIITRTDCVTLRDIQYQPTAEAKAAGRGTALVVDGNVQTIDVQSFNAVSPLRGVDLRNSAGLPLGQRPAFLFCDSLKVDFPTFEAVRIAAVDRARFGNCYFHGSQAAGGFLIESAGAEITMSACNSTSHYGSGMHFRGSDLDMWGCDFDNNSQGASNWGSGLAIESAARVSVTGGSFSGARHAWGVVRLNAAAAITVTGARLGGINGGKNF